MKRFLKLGFLAAALTALLTISAFAVTDTVTDRGYCGYPDRYDLAWTLYDDGELVISGTGAMRDYERSYSNYQWSTNAPWFSKNSSLKKVTITEGVTTIGDNAFIGCTGLTSVAIPASMTDIGTDTFYDCDNLNAVYIRDMAAWCGINFGNSAANPLFAAGNLYLNGALVTDLVIPEGVSVIGDSAFIGCTGLTSVTIPASVTDIEGSAFSGRGNLNAVYIRDMAAWCGINFGNSTANPLFAAGNLYLNGALVTDLVIPEGVSDIGRYAFYKCTSLTSVTVPASVINVGVQAFYQCENLTSVKLGDGVTSVAGSAFYLCTSLKDMTLPLSVSSIGAYAFDRCSSLTQVYYGGTDAHWSAVSVGEYNDCLLLADRQHYHTESVLPAVLPTCTESGLTEGKECAGCGEILSEQETIAAFGHSETVVPALAPTCIQDGLTEGLRCSVCEEILLKQEVVPATGQHGYEVRPAVNPTCTTTGLTRGAGCPTCDEKNWIEQEIIPALGHTEEVIPAVASTCTATGLTEGTYCTVCNEILQEQMSTPVASHTPVFAEEKLPTCTEAGYSADSLICAVCGKLLMIQEEVPPLGHTSVGLEAVEPTCEDVGLTEGVQCSVCGEVLVEQEEVAALGHTEEELPAAEATCTESGLTAGVKCSACGEVLTAQEEIAALGHIKGESVTEGNDTVVYCTVCGEELSRETVIVEEALLDASTFMTTMSLENELNMLFGVNQSLRSDWTGVYAKIVKEVDGKEPVTKIIPSEEWGFMKPYHAIEFSGVAGKEMTDKFTLQLFDANDMPISTVREDSVRDYALRAYSKTTATVRRTMFVDMLNYGAAAQEYFSYNLDDLANAGLTEEQMSYATATEDVTLTDCQETEGDVVGMTLDLGSRILIMVGVNGVDETCYATYSYKDHYGKLQTGRIEGEDFGNLGGVTAINMDTQVLADARQPFTLEVWNEENERVAYVYDSLEAYIYRALVKYENDLFVAIMKFADAAYNMLHA